MPLTNQNTQIFQLSPTGFKPEPIENYAYDQDLLDEFKVTIVGTFMVSYSDIDMHTRSGQIRAKDIDPAHVDRMKMSIQHSGITDWIVGSLDPKTKKINLLSGHHRVTALLDLHLDTESPIFPVMLVKHHSKLSKRQWMRKENLHTDVARPSSKDDAVLFIKEMKDEFNLFKNLDDDQTKKKVNDLLNEYFPFVKTTAKKYVYDHGILGKPVSSVKTITKQDQINLQNSEWGNVYGASKTIGNISYITSEYNPSRKGIMMQCLERSIAHENDPNTSAMEIKLITWFTTKVSNPTAERQKALESYKRMNLYILNEDMGFIGEVIFPEQDKTKNLNNIHTYTWDPVKKDFV